MLKKLFAALLLAAVSLAANAVTVYSSPFGPKPQFIDANGVPMSSGSLLTYIAGTTTAQVTYTDSTGGTSNPTTITLNTRGETPNELWFAAGVSYKLILKDSSGVTVWTIDALSGINDVTAQTGSEWIASGFTPTYISATSFSVTGDQTTTLQVGRRLKTTNTAGTIYSTITASVFASVTTVTVANDSSTLDSGLSAVSYGIVAATNPSISSEMVYRKGAAVTAASTTNVWGIVGDYVHVTGTTTITSLGTAPYAGAQKTIVFDGALTLTYNATTLITPCAANLTTSANDRAIVRADTTANMIVIDYIPANGVAIPCTRSANTVLSGPSSGAAAVPTFRQLAPADTNFSQITNSLSGDVSLNNTATFFDGPSVAQGTSGTWFCSGTVTLNNVTANSVFIGKLWDGTTVIAATDVRGSGNGTDFTTISLSGYLASPAANIRISVKETAFTTAKIVFNATGTSKDSTVSCLRIAANEDIWAAVA